jgi:hypothetical protein
MIPYRETLFLPFLELPDGVYFAMDSFIYQALWEHRALEINPVMQDKMREEWFRMLESGDFADQFDEMHDAAMQVLWISPADGAPASRDAADRALSLSSLGRVDLGNVPAEDE